MSGAVEAGASRVARLVDSPEQEMDQESGRHGLLTTSTSVRVCVPDIKKHCICTEMAAMYECLYVCCISLYMYMYVFTVVLNKK